MANSEEVKLKRRVWIDTDPSIGIPVHDADDGFAIALALSAPELEVAGISVTYGNTSVERSLGIAREMVALFGGEMPVIAGAAGPDDPAEAAADALAAAVEEGPLSYIALGPLTNLAAALKRHPELGRRIERVIFVGGRSPGTVLKIGKYCWYTFHDANFEKDPNAAEVVLQSGVSIMLIPIELSSGVRLTKCDLRRIGKSENPAGKYLAMRGWLWLRLWCWLVWIPAAPVFDVLAVVAAAHSCWVGAETRKVHVSRNVQPPELLAEPDGAGVDCEFATTVSANAMAWIMKRLTEHRP